LDSFDLQAADLVPYPPLLALRAPIVVAKAE